LYGIITSPVTCAVILSGAIAESKDLSRQHIRFFADAQNDTGLKMTIMYPRAMILRMNNLTRYRRCRPEGSAADSNDVISLTQKRFFASLRMTGEA